MVAKPVQISIDEDLLRRIDADADVIRFGRSAVVRRALLIYLRAKEKREIDDAIAKAYCDVADELLLEVEDIVNGQTWPDE